MNLNPLYVCVRGRSVAYVLKVASAGSANMLQGPILLSFPASWNSMMGSSTASMGLQWLI